MHLSGISRKKGSRLSARVALACGVTVATLLSPLGGQAFAGDAQPPVASDTPAQAPQDNNPKEKLPVVYISGSNELRPTADLFASMMSKRGFDVHPFMVWEPTRPETSPYVTVKGNSARIPEFIEKVKKETGSDKVDVVTYSQGGLVTRYWLKDFDGAKDVRTVVSLSGLIKGSPYQTQALEKGQCPPASADALVPPGFKKNPTDACLEMAEGGEEVTRLNTPTEALPGIRYVNITTRQEYDAAPYQINLMDGPGDYQNVITQDLCPNDVVPHLGMTLLPSVQSLVASALEGGPLKMECSIPAPEGLPTVDSLVPPLTEAPQM